MLDFRINPVGYQMAEGVLRYTENGEAVYGGVFAPEALVGLHLTLPRALGAVGVRATLIADGHKSGHVLPLSPCLGIGSEETFAALFEAGDCTSTAAIWTLTLTLDCMYGTLVCLPCGGGRLVFAPAGAEGAAIPLLFAERASVACAPGAFYQYPLAHLQDLSADAIPGFFAHLSSLGVSGLYLGPPAGEGACGNGQGPSACLPPAFVAAAHAAGVHLYGDLLYLAEAPEDRDMLLGGNCPGVVDGTPAPWDTPPLSASTEPPVSLSGITEPGGTVERALSLGYTGLVIRAADCFGDAFLAAVHDRLSFARQGIDAPLLYGGTSAGAISLAFGTRRRFFGGGELDAPLSYRLRDALLSYFVEQESVPLFTYLRDYLAALPPAVQAHIPHLLSTGECGFFYDAVRQKVGADRAEAITSMARLIAATLPGVPAYYAGEEWEMPGSGNDARLALCLRLSHLREREDAYHGGRFSLLCCQKDLLVFSREKGGEALLTLVNPTEKTWSITSPEGFFAVLGGRGRKTQFSLRPCTGMVIKLPRWAGETCHLSFQSI